MSSLKTCLSSTLLPEYESLLLSRLDPVLLVVGSRTTLSSSDPQTLHKLRVRLSALIQSKDGSVCIAGSRLISTLVGVDWDSLSSHGAVWLKLLMSNIEKKHRPLHVLQAEITTIQTIVDLCHDKPSIVREVIRPAIPSLSVTLLEISCPQPSFLDRSAALITLPLLCTLVSHFPTTMRPHQNKLMNQIIFPVLNSICDSGRRELSGLEQSTRKLFVLMYKLAPKDHPREWRIAVLNTIAEGHKAFDRAISEIVQVSQSNINENNGWESKVFLRDPFIAILRLQLVFRVLDSFLSTPVESQVQVPISGFTQLLCPILELSPSTIEFKSTCERKDRDFLVSLLPLLQAHAISLSTKLVQVIGQSIMPHVDNYLTYFTQLVKPTCQSEIDLLLPAFEFLTVLLPIIGSTPDDWNPELTHIIDVAITCVSPMMYAAPGFADYSTNPDLFTKHSSAKATSCITRLFTAIINTSPNLPISSRSKIDRYSLLSSSPKSESLLFSSVMQPGKQIKWSVLPMAIRNQPISLSLGSVVHPRFPPMPKREEDMFANLPENWIRQLNFDDNFDSGEVSDAVDNAIHDENPVETDKDFDRPLEQQYEQITKEELKIVEEKVKEEDIKEATEVTELAKIITMSPTGDSIIETMDTRNSGVTEQTESQVLDLQESKIPKKRDSIELDLLESQSSKKTRTQPDEQESDEEPPSDFEIPEIILDSSSDEEE
ncbi:rRNA processing/ribosome biogenesis-domain-containing protein [Lipomyces oligophaga]|uniref:rRNA processing/ribosome biogenesis-domain-containing protein n=1 Tax=Lipomyces oligophaga TaxID=45792 RepID=UPI0034CF35B8